ncbi:23S rRNA (guanosine(2251)-2'-O)-methyltransferase RlmB [Desulfosporosinus sp. HMP52]|uniref:23S rRNA (guanosine(2251)-2'-O)-methyltransferase RlmB n=1 Tax=Desulfosporosinus sp. HMP52 TaxID=1487923 RepID=UPI001969C3A3|nr:23S rRNA (guanosine(2251)-2'-O)-methyltransferase RlmB [Desulfosporosinus sp. HMP52]
MNFVNEEIVYGKNPVAELLKSGKPINKVLLVSDGPSGKNQDIMALLHKHNTPYQFVDRQTLDRLTNRERHQGMLAYVAASEYANVEDILALAVQRQEDPFILMLDEIEDPHNLGALLRTVDAVGAHGVIIPKRRSVALTGTVAKTSAGAVEHVKVARVSNLVQTLKDLKKAGCWVSGAEAGGTNAFKADLTGPRVIVIGSEGKGISRLLRENCDEIVSLPMRGQVSSLNASVAGSVMLYEVLRQRIQSEKPITKI